VRSGRPTCLVVSNGHQPPSKAREKGGEVHGKRVGGSVAIGNLGLVWSNAQRQGQGAERMSGKEKKGPSQHQ